MKATERQERGAAEMVGVLMLIAIFVSVVAVIAVVLFSQPAPEKIPALTMIIKNESRVISLSHEAGDNLRFEQMTIRVDDQDVPFGEWSCLNCGADLSVGDRILIDYSSDPRYDNGKMPNKVDIIYNDAGQERRLLITKYLGTMTPTLTPGTTPTTPPSPTTSPTPTQPPAPDARFTGEPTFGVNPLSVQFTDGSTNSPTSWLWDFGDGNTTGNNLQNPEHLYTDDGVYTVTLTVTNEGGSDSETRTDYILVDRSFEDFVVEENVGVYGTKFHFDGNVVYGDGATIFISGPLVSGDLNGGSTLLVSTIYVNGDLTLEGGSASLGSPTAPGTIYVNGDLTLGSGGRNIYGDVHVAGNFYLKDAKIHDIVYVDGDLTLDWEPTLDADARIYYTGDFTHPQYMSTSITDKCIYQATVPAFEMPIPVMPPANSPDWFAQRGYVSGGALTSNLKIFADSYSSTTHRPDSFNVIIVARTGDITLTNLGGSSVSGVLFAPNGRVIFNGKSFEGVALARDGFYVTSGGTTVTFRNLDDYFSSPDDYPF